MRLFSWAWATVGVLAAQSFEVATIKPNGAADNRISIGIHPGGRFTATGMNIKQLIAQAYDLRDFQITGGPSWIESERFDINAKAEGLDQTQGPWALRPYLKNLLAERFQMKAHEDTKEMQVYVLVPGKGPLKMKASEVQPPAEGGPPARPGGPDAPRGMIRMGRGQINANGVPMAQVVRVLSNQLGRPVIDKTGLKGNYDLTLEWTPEGAADAAGGSGPTIFTAVQEQLGLKLESEKAPGKILVVDSITKPSEN